MPKGEEVIMTNVCFIEVLSVSEFKKTVAVSKRSAEKFCNDSITYYKSKGFEVEVKQSKEDKNFFGVFSKRNGKLMAFAGNEQNTFFWRKHTTIKKNIEEANGVPQKAKGSKYLFYAVISAEFSGFVRTWDQCKKYTHGKSAKFKGFNAIEAAKVWMRENHAADASFEHITDIKQIK